MCEVKGNFFQVNRKIFDSDIWFNIVELRLFLFLIGNAKYDIEQNNKYGIAIKRGQFLRSLRNLQSDLQYKENHQIKNYGINTIKRAIDNLIKKNRIKIDHTELGTLFTIVNYDKYQLITNNENSNLAQQQYNDNKDNKEKKKKKKKEEVCPEPSKNGSELTEIACELPTNKYDTQKEIYKLSKNLYDEFKIIYTNCNVDNELKKMKAWLLSNPSKRKTIKGMQKFINAWLAREHDRNPSSRQNRSNNFPVVGNYSKLENIIFNNAKETINEECSI